MSDFYGVDEDTIIQRIESGDTLAKLASESGRDRATLSRWLNADPQRSARARVARNAAAQAWDEKAETEIEGAQDAFTLSRAKELAHHWRWRASKIAPKDYGDRTTLVGDPEAPLQSNSTVTLTAEDAYKRMIGV